MNTRKEKRHWSEPKCLTNKKNNLTLTELTTDKLTTNELTTNELTTTRDL